ncbi:MAG: glycoside hydrolase family 5 protein [Pseudolabrys sp.]|nr:glycoside hydrolase family 5 protein [Pseudolabrys sp.]
MHREVVEERRSILTRVVAPIVGALALAMLSSGSFAQSGPPYLTGVNIAGAEFNGRKVPGVPNRDYFYPAKTTIDYVASKGMTSIRVPFLWERMQPQLNGPLDAEEVRRLDDVVRYATGKRLYVVLDLHNYAYYRQKVIGSPDVPPSVLADIWRRLAAHFKDNPLVGFGLMNEPKGLLTETWLSAANAAIAAIRGADAGNTIFVPGNGWTGAHSWLSSRYGAPNGDVMLGVVDPANNYVYEVHQYLDSNYSGTHAACRSETVGVDTLQLFTQWARQNRKRAYLGEFGAGADPVCLGALNAMLTFIDENRDVWVGWSYWAAGAWPPSYFTSVQPVNGVDRPQMSILLQHLGRRPRGAKAGPAR